MSCMNVVTANLIIYQIGKRLFDGNRKKADLMLVFVCVLQLFCGTIYSSGTFSLPEATRESHPCQHCHPAVLMCRLVSGRKTTGMSGSYCLSQRSVRWHFRFCYHLSYRDRSGNGSRRQLWIRDFQGWYIVQCNTSVGIISLYFCMQNRSADAGCIIIQKGKKNGRWFRNWDCALLMHVWGCTGFLLVSSSVCCRTICTLVLGRKRKSGIFIGYTVFLLLTVYNR